LKPVNMRDGVTRDTQAHNDHTQ